VRKIVLIVDDNQDILEIQKLILELEGYNVYTAESGADGLRQLREIEHVDLILLDMNLDDMSGLEFLKLLRSHRMPTSSEVPVVFLSGMDRDQIPVHLAEGFIRKGTDVKSFVRAVNKYMVQTAFC
jgi:CheY-like chemotaxis protein